MQIKIGDTLIGDKQPCFIIAEAGVNHNGDVKLAKKLIDAAKIAGADVVKFQTWITEEIVIKSTRQADYQAKNTGIRESQFDMLKKLELTKNDFKELKDYADKKGIIFLSTPDEEKSADFLFDLGVPAFKIGSGEITNLPFLRHVAGKKRPIILSTGMADLNEVKEAVKAIKSQKNNKIIILHCTSNYPCPLKEVNLRAIDTLRKFDLPVGYSDHTVGIMVPVMAVARGAAVLEKHFTIDKNLPGPDHKASLDPKELKEMIKLIRDAEKALGDGIKKPTESEQKIKKVIRKILVAREDIAKGTKIKKNMLAAKRAGIGISPKDLDMAIGRWTKINIKKDNIIKFNQLQ